MIYAVLLTSLAAFIQIVKFTGLIDHVNTVGTDLSRAFGVIQNPTISAAEKESALQAAAMQMFALFFAILVRTIAAMGAAILVVLMALYAGLFSATALKAILFNWPFLVITIAATPFLWRLTK